MSVYNVYIKTVSDNIEVNIPDIYKDADSETTSEQIKVYICNKLELSYDSIIFDLKRNKTWKRKCNNEIIILDNDELYFYKRDTSQDIDVKKIKIQVGFNNINDALFSTNINSEKVLNKILSNEEVYLSKLNIILKDFDDLLVDEKIKELSKNLVIYNCQLSNLCQSFPFNEYNGGWFFGFIKSGIPNGYGYFYDFKNKIFYEGRFIDNKIYDGKCINLHTYLSYNDCYIDYKESAKGTKIFVDKNEKYDGFFHEGLYSGGGKLINENGILTGIFDNGMANGYGFMIYKNGDIYSGFWNKGKRNNYGKFNYNNGNYYSGTWVDDYMNIFGILYDSSLNISYIGTFNNGKRTFNKDEHILIDGSILDNDIMGEYCNEIEKSKNECIQKSTNTIYYMERLLINSFNNRINDDIKDLKQKYYVGHYDFMQNFHGFGKLFYNRGENIIKNEFNINGVYSNDYFKMKYKGYRTYHTTFKDGIPNGFGMIEFENGDKYIGGIIDGEVSGNGTLFKSDGNKIKAFWNRNISICKVI